ncbi:MAG: hypothetical protein ACI9WU_005362 [Myxococcota bacterium]|jgi:hypothetical protein
MRTRSRRLRAVSIATIVAFVATLLVPGLAMAKKPPTGKVDIFSFVKGAHVEINGKSVGKLPLPKGLRLIVGEYTLRVHKRGYTEFSETIRVKRGQTLEVEADLIPFAGVVKIEANVAGATVAVDGKLVGTVPFDKDIPAGKHEIRVQAKGYKTYVRTVDLQAGRAMRLDVQLAAIIVAKKPGPIEDPNAKTTEDGVETKWWFWTIIGVVVAGGATAAGVLATQGEDISPVPDQSIQLR